MKTKVLLVDNHTMFSEGVRTILERYRDVEVTGTAENGFAALQSIQKSAPDVVVMDIAMPGLNGIDTTRKIMRRYPGIKVIALSVHAERPFVQEMLKAGASGYLLKDSAVSELIGAIREVAEDGMYLSPKLQGLVVRDYVNKLHAGGSPIYTRLTTREREILQMLTEGQTTKEIASVLHSCRKTVESHRRNIMNKLDIHSIAELTKFAVREGLTSLEV